MWNNEKMKVLKRQEKYAVCLQKEAEEKPGSMKRKNKYG